MCTLVFLFSMHSETAFKFGRAVLASEEGLLLGCLSFYTYVGGIQSFSSIVKCSNSMCFGGKLKSLYYNWVVRQRFVTIILSKCSFNKPTVHLQSHGQVYVSSNMLAGRFDQKKVKSVSGCVCCHQKICEFCQKKWVIFELNSWKNSLVPVVAIKIARSSLSIWIETDKREV